MKMKDRVEKLEEPRRRNEGMGGPERIERQHAKGKLPARERLKRPFDENTFEEMGLLGEAEATSPRRMNRASPPPRTESSRAWERSMAGR